MEFGVGNGEITQLILNQSPKHVIGYEIDSQLNRPFHPHLTIQFNDFTKVNFDFLRQGGPYGIICNPPYSTILFIKEQIIDQYKIEDVIMMIPPKYQSLFPDYQPLLVFDGAAFTPTSKNNHIVVGRGFNLDQIPTKGI